MYIVKNKKECCSVYLAENNPVLKKVGEKLVNIILTITGTEVYLCEKFIQEDIGSHKDIKGGIVLSTFANPYVNKKFAWSKESLQGDGFGVFKSGNYIYILGLTAQGVVFGVADFIEKNSESIFSRGCAEESFQYIPCDDFIVKKYDYIENSPFAIRSWNFCGLGSENIAHSDYGTSENAIFNKVNGTVSFNDSVWKEYGIRGSGITYDELGNLDYLIDEHPDYFMTSSDGLPMRASEGYNSFVNYYSDGMAKAFAEKLVEVVEKYGDRDIPFWTMPDNPYFNVVENGIKLQEQPFVCEDKTIVYPTDKYYKSTVYFDFFNRVMKEANRMRKDTYLGVFAYIYSEEVPPVSIDEHLIVYVAPIYTNERYSLSDEQNKDNEKIRSNIEAWSKKTDKLAIYTYWECFDGSIYSRPVVRNVQKNLRWFRKLKVYQLENESQVDCTLSEACSHRQKKQIKYHDMNEMYIWIINKLMWNPDENIDDLISRYTKIVYKESSEEMKEYFALIEKGWNSQDALVWYNTGGDVYYLQFIINSGIADDLVKVLSEAIKKASSNSVKRKISSIYETIKSGIDKYKNFQKESATVTYCEGQDILSENALDYINNDESFWNKAVSLKVLKNYSTMEDYPSEAKFSCKMMYDEENFYVAYTTFDNMISEVREENGRKNVYRKDGSIVESYAETYVGGNILNQSEYYGFISGFMDKGGNDQFYCNTGSPEHIKTPDGVRDIKYVHLDKNSEKNYLVHVQVIPFEALGVSRETAGLYGSFVYYTNRYGRAGWMGFGLWSKPNFQPFKLKEKNKEGDDTVYEKKL